MAHFKQKYNSLGNILCDFKMNSVNSQRDNSSGDFSFVHTLSRLQIDHKVQDNTQWGWKQSECILCNVYVLGLWQLCFE